jgi:hypothetical protein
MEFSDLQVTLAVVILVGAALVAIFDFRRKQSRQRLPRRIRSGSTVRLRRPILMFDSAPAERLPAQKLRTERPIDPLLATAPISKLPMSQTAARETVTIQMTVPLSPLNRSADGPSSKPGTDSLPAITIDAALWDRLVASMPKQDVPPAGDAGTDPMRSDPELALTAHNGSQTAWPTGMIQPPAYQKLLDDGRPFSGLVVSIGINDADSSMWHSQGLIQSVGSYIAGMLREKDFACRTAYDEFIWVCCGEQGAQAQRRLNHISERLWDYQLRGIGARSILFSWGGVQVQDQPLAEAVASAVDRMRQTKRSTSPSGLARAHSTSV